MATSDKPTNPSKKIFCNGCKGFTNHTLRAEHASHSDDVRDGDLVFWTHTIYRFWTCCGCDAGSLEEEISDPYIEHMRGDGAVDVSYYPKRSELDLPVKRFNKLPKTLESIYSEVTRSFNSSLPILCGAGLRALLEGICDDKKIKGRNLEEKIDGLRSILPENIVTSLHGFRFMGNAALHDLAPPKVTDLRLAIEVIEDLLNFVYELDYKASGLPKAPRASSKPAPG